MKHLDHIHRTNGAGIIIKGVQQRQHCLLVRGGHVQPAQLGKLAHKIAQPLNIVNLEVEVFSVYAFGREFLVEEVAREGVRQWVADKAVNRFALL